MFRVVLPPIIRSTYNCIYSIWYLSHCYCYLPLSWKCWNRFECAVVGVRHPQHTDALWCKSLMHGTMNLKGHMIFQCERLKYERGMLKNSVLKAGNWPVSKSELVNKNLKQFILYIDSIVLEKLNHSKSCKGTLITDMYNYISMLYCLL
jgi:hypothetical protein